MPDSQNAPADQSVLVPERSDFDLGTDSETELVAGPTQHQNASPSVLVGIPAYNEAETIRDTVVAAKAYADEVLVVDDGSTDETGDRVQSGGATLLRHTENQGYGAALETIFNYAHLRGVKHLLILDADRQHDISDIPDLIATQQETGAELVTGSRFTGDSETEMPRYRQLGLTVINSLTNLSLRLGYSYTTLSDTQCGFRAYDSEAIETMATAEEIDSGMGASLDILFQAAREGHDIVEVPTQIQYNVENPSSKNPVIHGVSLLKSLFLSVIRDRPVRMGSILGLSCLSLLGISIVLQQTTMTAISLFAPVLFVFVLLFMLILPKKGRRGSDRTDQ